MPRSPRPADAPTPSSPHAESPSSESVDPSNPSVSSGTPSAPLPPNVPPAQAPQIGNSVKRGMTWSVANTIIAKSLSFISIAILGLILSPEDFGLFGTSFSIAAFVQIFRDGGVVQLLVQRGEAHYASLRGPVFWMAGAFNTTTGLVLALLAPFLSQLFGQPKLLWLLLVIGMAMPLATVGVVLQARLAMQLRFARIARIQLISSFIRYGSTITLASLGMGPMSFVLPLPVIAIYEGIAAYLSTRETPWRDRPSPRLWRGLFLQSRWLIFVAFANASLNQGSYLALATVVSPAVVGVFFFAYQFITQVDAVLSATAGAVLFPALSRLANEPARFRAAVLRSARTIMFLAAPMTAALLAGFDAFEDVLWHNRWDVAVFPVQALSLLYGARVLFMVPSTSLMARGRFKTNACLVLFCGVGMTLSTILGALTSPHPESIAVWLGAYIGFGCLAFTVFAMTRLGIMPRALFAAISPVWAVSWVAAAAAISLDLLIRPHLLPTIGSSLDWLARAGTTFPLRAGWNSTHDATAGIITALSTCLKFQFMLAGVLRLSIIAVVMGVIIVVLLRLLFVSRLREGLHLAPMRFHRLIDRLFLLPRR